MTKRKLIFALAGVLLACALVGGGAIYSRVRQQWTVPLGPALEMPTHTPPAATPVAAAISPQSETPAAQDTGQTPAAGNIAAAPDPTMQPTAAPLTLCGGPPVMYVLAVGADNRDDTYLYGLADVIRIARVDFVTPKLTMLSMPRDLWVEIPDISEHYNITHGKLNQAYFYGGPGQGYYDGPGAGPGLLARTLDLNFGIQVDHYGAVNMQTFVKIVDAVGGIDIYLPKDVDGRPIDDKTEDMGYFVAGQHHFTGSEALRFARIRKKYNDFTRMDNQNMVMCALREKVLSPSVLPKAPQIIASFQDSVLTDLSLEQLTQLACLAPQIDRENIIFAGLPDEILEPSRVYSPQQKNRTFILDTDFDLIRDYVEQFMAGDWPNEPEEPTCP